jgi:hypothetical protein
MQMPKKGFPDRTKSRSGCVNLKKKRQEEDEDGDGEEAHVLVCEWDVLRLMKVWLRGCVNQQTVKNEHGKESNRRECNSL